MGFEFDITVLVVFSIISFIISRIYGIDIKAWYTFLTNVVVLIALGGAWMAYDIERATTILINAMIGEVIGSAAGMFSEPIIDLISYLFDFLGV